MPLLAPFSQSLERETGIEPATNSLEGCDSTTELLPLLPLLLTTLRSLDFARDLGGRLKRLPNASTWKAVTLPLSYSRETQLSALSRQLSVKPQRLKSLFSRLLAARLKHALPQN